MWLAFAGLAASLFGDLRGYGTFLALMAALLLLIDVWRKQ